MDYSGLVAQIQSLLQQVQQLQSQQGQQAAPAQGGAQGGVPAPASPTLAAQPQLRVPPMGAQAAPMQAQAAAAGRNPTAPLVGQNMTPTDQMRQQQAMSRLLEQRRATVAGASR